MQVQRVGSPNAAVAAQQILLDTRAKLYGLLAADWASTDDAPARRGLSDQPSPATWTDEGDNGRMAESPSIRARLARRFDPVELRAIKKLWVRHSIAEDARDIDGLIATLAPDCVYEIVPTGQRWEGHDGARGFYTELFAAFPDNRFSLTDIVVGPQGVFEAAQLTGTNLGPWAGVPASGLPVSLQVLILFPWDPVAKRFAGERIWFDRGALGQSAERVRPNDP